eukprot:TRINITY_DN7171_c1_g1_i7.p1 TRINITY_DN7171_c1_g1~~TRINITY_DN7171_c1_g1_i7.p1  ORF type:complete len:157 (-),score=2.19 TRINITY_DN7171_c1_g1_i7:117-587(-)
MDQQQLKELIVTSDHSDQLPQLLPPLMEYAQYMKKSMYAPTQCMAMLFMFLSSHFVPNFTYTSFMDITSSLCRLCQIKFSRNHLLFLCSYPALTMLRQLYGVLKLPDVILFSRYENLKKLLSFVIESAKLLRAHIWDSDQDSISDMNVSEDRVGIG